MTDQQPEKNGRQRDREKEKARLLSSLRRSLFGSSQGSCCGSLSFEEIPEGQENVTEDARTSLDPSARSTD